MAEQHQITPPPQQPMTHPLTDDILISKFLKHARKFNSYTFDYTSDGMRAAYDKGAADMLEQVLHWLRTTQWYLNPSTLADLLEEAMRPRKITK